MGMRRTLAAALVALAGSAVLAGCGESSRLNLRCMAGDIQRCWVLADMYATGTRVPRNLGRAAELYERVCASGVAEVCNTLGEMYDRDPAFDTRTGEVARLYELACSGAYLPGCVNLGFLAAEQDDFEGAAALYDRACSGGLEAGCHFLAAAYERGEGVRQDVPRAVALYERACDEAYVDSCLSLVTLFTEGALVERDLARTAGYYGRLIFIYDSGCEDGFERDCTERDRIRTRLMLLQAGAR
jgi:uncharacterized protein